MQPHPLILPRRLTTAFTAPDIELARSQWVLLLHDRMQQLEQALHIFHDVMDYGGAASQSFEVEPLEAAVDEARRMVCALSGEMRRRSEGELPVWEKLGAVVPKASRIASAGT